MAFWEGEIKELGSLYDSFKGHLPDIVKELEQLIKTDDPNVVMLYSRRCLEVIVTDLCENELKRPRKTEPLKGIIDKLNAEEKVPSYIITSMIGLNSMANYGAHPKDFDPEQVKPVLNNLAIIIKWYLKYKDFKIVSKAGSEEKEQEFIKSYVRETGSAGSKPQKKGFFNTFRIVLLIILTMFLALIFLPRLLLNNNPSSKKPQRLQLDGNRVLFTDPLDNELYTEINIGSQIWMGENLRASKFNDGTSIPLIKDPAEWEKTTEPAYCWYNNKKSNYSNTAYGALYNWFAVNTGKLCPVGWHVPSADEWEILFTNSGDTAVDRYAKEFGHYENDYVALKLMEAGNQNWQYCDTISATNETGFTAMPGGLRTIYGVFWGIGEEGNWWTATADILSRDNKDALDIEMNYTDDYVTNNQQYKQTGMSVRCVKDSIN
jgi:uncharacterized protein (TIGR02145 family)